MATIIEQENDDCLVEVPIRLSLAEAERLAHLVDTARRSDTGLAIPSPLPEATPQQLAAFASFLLCARRRRDAVYQEIEFGEPAWDMLLDLYVQHVAGKRVGVSSLCTAAAVPATTALRWIDVMTRNGSFTRQRDPHDARRVYVSLTPGLIDRIEIHLSDMRRRAAIALQ
jgi:DNA-binding MarR family transcriptional regulator